MAKRQSFFDGPRANALFENASIGILMTNPEGLITMVNSNALDLFGYDEYELQGQPIDILIPMGKRSQHAADHNRYMDHPHMRKMGHQMQITGLTKSGEEIDIEVGLSPFKTEEGYMVFSFIQDIRDRRAQEKAISAHQKQLVELNQELTELNQRLEEKVAQRTLELERAKAELELSLQKEKELSSLKSRFVTIASHEFRTPLSGVLSSAGLIERYLDKEDTAAIRKHTELIKKAVNQMNSVLGEFLSLGRLEEGKVEAKFTAIHLPELISEVHEQLREQFKEGQVFSQNHNGEAWSKGDADILRNILTNLLANAIKYSPEGAKIRIESQVLDGKNTIKVVDNGPGIPEIEQAQLFNQFFRASNSTNVKGTGLGLYIVKRYAEMLNADCSFVSKPGEGSSFWITWEA
jgi:PAS domain S-box-containing protein